MAADKYSYRSPILFAFFVALMLLVAWQIRHVLLLIYIAALFAVVIGPAIGIIERIRIGKWHPNRGIAIVLIIVLGLGLIALFFVFALPPIFRDLQAFGKDLPNKLQNVYDRIEHIPILRRLDVSQIQQHVASAIGGAFGVAAGIANGLFTFFSWLVLAAYFVLDGERAFRWFISLFPHERRARLIETASRADYRVSKWLIGQALLMLILGSLSTLVFGLLHVKYFYALGVFCGLANIVPIVGPVVSVGLAAIVAAFDSWSKAAGVIVFYLIYQQVENAYLTPRIMKSTVDLPALAVIVALAIGGSLAGILGALVAVPTAAVIAVIVDEYVIKKHEQA